MTENHGEIILYQPNSETKLEVRLVDETIWLTQAQIAELFGTKRPAITKHINNIYANGELRESGTCSILEHKGNDGLQTYKTKYYNLDVILSVGYRVNSINATIFRQWANQVLKEYLLRGYSVNQRIERLEQRITNTEQKIDFFVRTSLPPIEGIFFDGQIFDAYAFVANLIKRARKEIILIDNYIDETILTLFDKRSENVVAIIYTSAVNKQLQLDINKHNAQYPPIDVKIFAKSHDRFLIIDNDVYLIGASIKDLGKKWFAFTKLETISKQKILNNIK